MVDILEKELEIDEVLSEAPSVEAISSGEPIPWPRRILIVEDNEAAGRQLQKLLQADLQLQVEVTNDGAMALQQLAEQNYSIVITDLRMPRMDGMELIREVQKGSLPVTVIVTTAHGSIDDAVQAIHNASRHRAGQLIPVNCAALPQTLLEGELFGHEKGAFTSAVGQRRGRFEIADGGTIFLDEVGDVPATMQAKLLRVLQERRFERVGGAESIEVDVRIIAATNRSLQRLVKQGTFREDLYYRLNVVKIDLPPLRERLEDIPLLATHFAQKYSRPGASPKQVSQQAMGIVHHY